MYLLGVLYMVGLTVALPVLPEPPQLPYPKSATPQEVLTNTPKVDRDSFPVEDNNKEVKEYVVKFHPLFIPPPPELPPFDYFTFIKQNAQKAKYDGTADSEVERSVEVVDINNIVKPVELIEEESKPIENSKFDEKVQPMEESKSIDESKVPAYPIYIEVPKSVEEPKSVDEPKSVEEQTAVEEPKSVEEPKAVEEPKSVEETKAVEEPKPIEELKPVEEAKESIEKPLEDIPVVVQFTIPTTTFLSSLISKLSSLSSFALSWPFHLPSIFIRPRAVYPDNNIDDKIYPS